MIIWIVTIATTHLKSMLRPVYMRPIKMCFPYHHKRLQPAVCLHLIHMEWFPGMCFLILPCICICLWIPNRWIDFWWFCFMYSVAIYANREQPTPALPQATAPEPKPKRIRKKKNIVESTTQAQTTQITSTPSTVINNHQIMQQPNYRLIRNHYTEINNWMRMWMIILNMVFWVVQSIHSNLHTHFIELLVQTYIPYAATILDGVNGQRLLLIEYFVLIWIFTKLAFIKCIYKYL